MDANLVYLRGSLAAPPEIREFESGSRLIRYLVTTRVDDPRRRVDVVPVTLWNPPDTVIAANPLPGRRIALAGSIQRRFWDGPEGRKSRLEIVASDVEFNTLE